MSPQEIEAGLRQFTGSDQVYYSPLWGRKVSYTEGVKWLLRAASCFWLFDLIAGTYLETPAIREDRITFWHLTVNPDHTGRLECKHDTDGPVHWATDLTYTDFPLPEMTLYLAEGESGHVLMLSSEY